MMVADIFSSEMIDGGSNRPGRLSVQARQLSCIYLFI
jgi:hypothetical protein